MKERLPIVLLSLIAAVLLFTNLSDQYLWQDEAETAVLAKNLLEYGYPRAYDGQNLVNPNIRTGHREDYGWRYHPWGQFYITAASFKLLGPTTFAARFPFALLGLLNILLLYALALRLMGSKFVATTASLLVALSVPYLLLMRQCRYYAPAVFLVLCGMYFYDRYVKSRANTALAAAGVCLVLLGYTVHGMFVPVLAGLALHYLVFARDRRSFPAVTVTGILVVLSVLPWLLYSNSGAHVASITAERLWKNLEFQVRMINKYVFPVIFFLGVYAVRAIWKRNLRVCLSPQEKSTLRLICPVIAASIAAFLFAEERNFRYLVYFIPLFAIIEGVILLRLMRFNRFVLASFLVISVFTGFFNMFRPDCYFPKYIYEITHDYEGPIEGITRFLNANAEDGDTVKIIYGDLPLMFYTDLKVDNSWVYDDGHMPEWIVFRHGWHEQLDNDYYTKVRETYKEHILPYPDIKWENRPGDLSYHRFATDKNAPNVIIFEKNRIR